MLIVALVVAGAVGLTAQAQSGPTLLVNDEITANPDLVETALMVPDGLDVDARTLNLPAGFSISVVAAGLGAPRFMAFDAAGNLIVADRGTNSIYRYPASADGVIAPSASPPEPLIAGLDNPTSVAVQDVDGSIWLYIGEESQIVRYPYEAGGPVGAQEIIVPDLPVGGHSTRTVLFGPDGWLYVSVGSSCNICDETEPLRATVSRYRADGSEGEIIATGLRNAVGLAIQPGTDTLWVTVNERDRQGDEIPPDLVTAITPGANYGWPDCLPPDATPQYDGAECEGVMPPTIGIQAHSAPLGLAFYQTSDGSGFPGEYAGDLFVVQHGSWNRSEPAPPRLLWIDMENGQPMAALDFATGWQDENGSRWGRPAGVIVAPDGSLLLTDDNAGLIYRITWTG
jgi:glucose/arabinose dehydrogenase